MPPSKPGGKGQRSQTRSCHVATPNDREHSWHKRDLDLELSARALLGLPGKVFEGVQVAMTCMGPDPVELPSMIRAPAIIHGNQSLRVRAVVDCAAQRSLVSSKLVRKLGRSEDIKPPTGDKFLRSFNDALVKRRGTIWLRVECGEHVKKLRFEVQDMEEDVLLGLDSLPKFEISIVGVPTQWPGQQAGLDAAQAAHTAESRLHAKKKVWTLEDQVDADDLETIINDLLETISYYQREHGPQPSCMYEHFRSDTTSSNQAGVFFLCAAVQDS
jgi:hypothetical protein